MVRILLSFANRNQEIKTFMTGLDSRVLIDVKGERTYYLEFSNGKASVHMGTPEHFEAVIKSDKRTMEEIVTGKLSQEEAFNRRLVEMSGSIADAMRVRYVINRTLEKSKLLSFMQRIFGAFL